MGILTLAMNFIKRWRHGSERGQEQLLVRLWTMNSMNADDHPEASNLTVDAMAELKPSLKYLSGSEVDRTIERTVSEAAYTNQFLHNLRKHMKHGRPER
jgi:hypothetical protein